jgi:hypothetical protein
MITPELIEKVLARARDTASHSWEYSTVFEALLEYRNPELTIFGPDPFPNGRVPELSFYHVEALRYVLPFIRTDEVTTTLCDGNGKPFDLRSIQAVSQNHHLRRPLRSYITLFLQHKDLRTIH